MMGMTGAMSVPTGTPASASPRMAPSRAAGDAARGSSTRFSAASIDVSDTITCTRSCCAICVSRSRSRSTSADFVTMDTGCLASSNTSRMERVTRRRRSTGWYGSVFAPSMMGAQR